MKFYRPRWMDGMVGSRIYLHHDDILYSTVRYGTVQRSTGTALGLQGKFLVKVACRISVWLEVTGSPDPLGTV